MTNKTIKPRGFRTARLAAAFYLLAAGVFVLPGAAAAEKVRVAMPSRSMTFLTFYIGDKFGAYKSEGLEVSLEVMKSDVGVAAVISGEMDYISAIGTTLRAAAAGVPLKAAMFTMDRVIFFLAARPEIKTIQDLKGGKSVAVSGVVATDAYGARLMAKAQGLNPEKDLVMVAIPDAADRLAALQSGAVTAAMLSLPFNFKAEDMGFRNLGGTADIMRSPFAGVGASDAKLRSNPSQVKRMIRATLRSMEFTRDPANLERVISLIADEFKVERKTAELAHREIVKAFTRDGTTPDETVMAEMEVIAAQAKLKGPVPLGRLVDYTILKEVLGETGKAK
ncbi:MAG TPA: ABC transporter substrate-binding protein [Candidatus Binatia bacterium]|jgi:ABC-type nitrate/sulfonate/bicarbonate transport system substrate-binding protein